MIRIILAILALSGNLHAQDMLDDMFMPQTVCQVKFGGLSVKYTFYLSTADLQEEKPVVAGQLLVNDTDGADPDYADFEGLVLYPGIKAKFPWDSDAGEIEFKGTILGGYGSANFTLKVPVADGTYDVKMEYIAYTPEGPATEIRPAKCRVLNLL